MDIILEKSGEFFETFKYQISSWVSAAGIFMVENFNFAEAYTFLVRLAFPVLAIIIFLRCLAPLLRQEEFEKVWGFLSTQNWHMIPIRHWENSIGRSKLSDIIINLPFISRSHAVLSYIGDKWQITDLGSKGGVALNGEKVKHTAMIEDSDVLSFSGAEFKFFSNSEEYTSVPVKTKFKKFTEFGKSINTSKTFTFLLIFQILSSFQMVLYVPYEYKKMVIISFAIYIGLEIVFLIVHSKFSSKYAEFELLVFFLCGMNLLVVASAAPQTIDKQIVAIILGVIAYIVIQIIISDYERARKFKYVLASAAIILILLNLILGETRYGARNWINLGFITFQPMEFVKVAFVLAGTATLDKLLTTRNLTAFLGFSGVCLGALVIMRDLGTAVIFFGAFLIIAFMRSGDLRTIAFISSGALLSAFAVVSFLPYIAARFKAWNHVWEYADTLGYQQTRTMIASASGGLFGVGGGKGFLVGVPAADTDLVFGMLCEEWGIIIGFLAVLTILFIAVYTVLIIKNCKSSLYAISACGASMIFLIQTALNVFGSLDFLPLTGVTLPFVSNGGSSMLVCWSLLAFIKSADERVKNTKEESILFEDEEENSDGEEAQI